MAKCSPLRLPSTSSCASLNITGKAARRSTCGTFAPCSTHPPRRSKAPNLNNRLPRGACRKHGGKLRSAGIDFEALQQLPPHPKTGATSAMAIISPGPEAVLGAVAFPVLFAEIKAYSHIASFSSNGPYYGEAVPDLAFVQLKVRDLPTLSLVTEPNTIRAGIPVATAGFPMGTDPLLVYGSINQLVPFLRKGIIS